MSTLNLKRFKGDIQNNRKREALHKGKPANDVEGKTEFEVFGFQSTILQLPEQL